MEIKIFLRYVLSLQYVFVLFSFAICLIKEKLGSDWFEKCLETKSGIERCVEYDFMSSMAFLKNQVDTSAFSPLCSDMNLLVQCSRNDFGVKNRLKGEDDLKFVMNQLKNIDQSLFNVLNCFYERGWTLQNELMLDGYLYKIFNRPSAEQIYKEHSEWVKTKSRNLLNTPLDVSLFKNSDRIYVSLIYFKDVWAKRFDTNLSYEDEFQLSSSRYISRNFMIKKDYFRYGEFYCNQIEFQITAIPYKDEKENNFIRYMVYLIPSKIDTDLLKLWDAFYTASNGKIKKFISRMIMKKIIIHIPIVDKLISNFNLTDLLVDVFKYNTAYNCSSTMATYINIDENGTEASSLMTSICTDSCGKILHVAANKPHISFIFDMKSERIPFIIKDTGIIKKEN